LYLLAVYYKIKHTWLY